MTLIQMRTGTAAQWTSANPVLDQGELGFEYDTLRLKGGNGVDPWSLLSYVGIVSVIDEVVEYANAAAFPATGVAGIIYVAKDVNRLYRWGGSSYIVVGVGQGIATLTGVETLTNKTLTSPKINTVYDANGNAVFNMAPVAAAVNFISVQNQATGQPPAVLASGPDTNIDLNLSPQGSGATVLYVSGTTAILGAGGVATNVDLNLATKGPASKVKANGLEVAVKFADFYEDPSSATSGNYTVSTSGMALTTTQNVSAAQLTIAGTAPDKYITNPDTATTGGDSAGYKVYDMGSGNEVTWIGAELQFVDTGSTSGQAFCLATSLNTLTPGSLDIPVHIAINQDHYSVQYFTSNVLGYASGGTYVPFSGGSIGFGKFRMEVGIDSKNGIVYIRDPFGAVNRFTDSSFLRKSRYGFYEVLYPAATTDDRARIHKIYASRQDSNGPYQFTHPTALLRRESQTWDYANVVLGVAQSKVGNDGTAPTIAAHSDAGTGATATVVSGGRWGQQISVTTGTSPVSGTLATLTWVSAFGAVPRVAVTPTSAGSAALFPYATKTTTTVVLKIGGTPLAATTYTFDVLEIG